MAEAQTKEQYKLGAFKGVFTPSILTIFGIIVFMRFGYVVGSAGLWGSVVILLISSAIAVLTSLSLVAIVSNMEVKGGGLYYIISRSLGVEYGASCGVILYFAQAVSVAFYIIGFSEIFCSIFPDLCAYPRILSTIVCIILFGSVLIGVNWVTKIQMLIMVVLFVALGVFLGGGIMRFDGNNLATNLFFSKGKLWLMFAIFFPAITGFTQGTSMSGDLKNPEKDIPRGIFAALLFAVIVYGVMLWIVSAAAQNTDLVSDYMISKKISMWGPVVDVGVICGALSSALASFLGAPRILQAVSRDRIFTVLRPFAKGYGPLGEPRTATVLTFIIAIIGIWAADLNKIAPVVTMFFLLTYGLMNYATFYEDYSNMPSFRPKFKYFHWRLSLFGTLLCVFAMFAINWRASIVAFLLIFALYFYTAHVVDTVAFGDAKRGFYFRKIKNYLNKLSREPKHSKDWRPQIMAFSGRPESRLSLVYFSKWLEGGRGFTTLAHIITGDLEDRINFKETEKKSLLEFIETNNLDAAGEVVVAPTFSDAVSLLVQSHGMSDIKPNTVLLGWTVIESVETYLGILRHMELLKKNIIVIEGKESLFQSVAERTRMKSMKLCIDVWWRGQKNGRMMLLLAYLLTQNREWSGSRIRLLRIVEDVQAVEGAEKHLNELISSSRIVCEPKVCIADKSVREVIVNESQYSDMVFIGMGLPAEGMSNVFYEGYSYYINKLPMTALVLCSEEIEL